MTGQSPVFLTFRLQDSLPPHVRLPPVEQTTGEAFVTLDRMLDGALTGPTFLARPEVARVLASTLHEAAATKGNFELHAFVIMPNHVHLLVTPRQPLGELILSLKSLTAYRANRVLSRVGMPFWQNETIHHWVRDEAELGRILTYVARNPVRAGLARRSAEFEWLWVEAAVKSPAA